jgi:hypothetical protein
MTTIPFENIGDKVLLEAADGLMAQVVAAVPEALAEFFIPTRQAYHSLCLRITAGDFECIIGGWLDRRTLVIDALTDEGLVDITDGLATLTELIVETLRGENL